MSSPVLTVTAMGSLWRFPDPNVVHTFQVDDKGNLVVYERDVYDGQEVVKALFHTWDYAIVEE